MSEVGQAIDFAIEHWEKPGWVGVALSNPLLQVGIIVLGLLLIYWDAKRAKPLNLPAPRRMIVGGLIIVVIGVIVAGIGLWRTADQPIATASLGTSKDTLPGTGTIHELQASPLDSKPQEKLSAEDISTKIGIWMSVDQQMDDFPEH
jgi:hypothetical protein